MLIDNTTGRNFHLVWGFAIGRLQEISMNDNNSTRRKASSAVAGWTVLPAGSDACAMTG